MRPRLDAVAVTSADFAKTVAFYECIGFEFPEFGPDDQHLEPVTQEGEARLMIDHVELTRKLTGRTPKSPSHSIFALLCDSPSQVDEIATRIKSTGGTVKTDPWDAFWGQRYATVVDPDGYEVDLFAPMA